MWVCGVVCGPLTVANPAGYELSLSERQVLCSRLCGCVVNVDHSGVHGAVATSLYATGAVSGRGVRAVLPHVGVVRDSWLCGDGTLWVLFEVFDACSGVCGLLEGGHLGCLSMTHYADGVSPVPVEVALCSSPARPFSFVRHAGWSLPAACEYKGRVLAGSIPSIPIAMEAETVTVPAVSRLEAALNALSAADRGLVEARFTEMMGAVDDANQAKTEAEKTLSHLKALKETDKKLMAQHFDTLAGLLPEDIRSQFLVNSDMRGILETAEPEVFHNVSQLIKCASAGMLAATSGHQAGASAAKRVRVEPAVAEVAEEAVPVVSGSVLSRALADTFAV